MSEPPSNPADSAPKRRISELDGMRAISVALVIVYHSWLWAKTVSIPSGMWWFIDYVGLLGVKIFFVISGFIITRLMLEEVAATGTFHIGDFFIKRVFRIIPAFWTYLSVTTLLIWTGLVYSDPHNLVPCLFFTSDFLQSGQNFFYAHSWSLSVEEQYYLLFPLLVILLARKGTRTTTIILVALYLVLIFAPNLGKVLRVRFNIIDIAFLGHFRYIVGGALLSIWWNLFGRHSRDGFCAGDFSRGHVLPQISLHARRAGLDHRAYGLGSLPSRPLRPAALARHPVARPRLLQHLSLAAALHRPDLFIFESAPSRISHRHRADSLLRDFVLLFHRDSLQRARPPDH
jgi:hypothetical protein